MGEFPPESVNPGLGLVFIFRTIAILVVGEFSMVNSPTSKLWDMFVSHSDIVRCVLK